MPEKIAKSMRWPDSSKKPFTYIPTGSPSPKIQPKDKRYSNSKQLIINLSLRYCGQ